MYTVFSNRCSILQDIDPYVKKKREPFNRGSILFNLFSFFTVCDCFKTIYIFKPHYKVWKKSAKHHSSWLIIFQVQSFENVGTCTYCS